MKLALAIVTLFALLSATGVSAQTSNEAPAEIRIDAINVLAPIEAIPVINGQMSPPTRLDAVGWYDASPVLGVNGNILMTGYYQWYGLPSTFARLGELVAGDEIIVWSASGRLYVYGVAWVRQFPKDQAPLADIVGTTDDQSLTLITDAGEWNGSMFLDSTVVRAKRTN